MNIKLNINSDAAVKLTNKLEKLHKSALPNAVRGTLNGAAFDMKKNTLLKSASDAFVERDKRFFKATSKVEMAKGFDMRTMQATVGFKGTGKGNNQAVDDLEKQEKGGVIPSRSFIPVDTARQSNSKNKMVRANARLKKIRISDVKNATGKSDKQKFVKTVAFAGIGGFVLSDLNGKRILWKVNSIKKTPDGKFKLTPLYSFEKGRKVKVGETGFAERAAIQTQQKINHIYNEQAQRQFKKYGF